MAKPKRPASAGLFLECWSPSTSAILNLRRERQLEEIAKAKAAGVYKDRPASKAAPTCAQ
jgi:hypothetical protein